MKISNLRLLLVLSVPAFMTTTSSSQATQYAPEEAMRIANMNRLNHVVLKSLHFCPRWYESVYVPQKEELIDKGRRLVLKTTGQTDVVLNPEHEPLGGSLNTIDLKKITETTARKQWGGKPNADGGITCDLITELGSPEMDIYHLDMKFTDEKLSAYRLRGIGILTPSWTILSTKTQEG